MNSSDESLLTVQQIVLRQPRGIRGQQGRGSIPHPLLPVFFAGDENRFAAFVCDMPKTTTADSANTNFQESLASLGPVLLVGPSGCGKTAIANHLAAMLMDQLSANQHQPIENPENVSLVSMSSIDFARLYARAVDSDDITQFRTEIQNAAILVIDDVHLIVDKAPAQEELAARLEARSADSLPTILTCRRLPTQVPGLRPLLVSRMLPGLTVPIRLPGQAARRALVSALSQRRDLLLSDDEIDLLCAGLPDEIPARQIESATRHLELWCRMKASRVTMVAIREAIASIEPTTEISTDQIAKTIARRCKLKLGELKSGTRRQEVVRARSLAMYLARQLSGTSYDKIGKYFGGRDHTTVLHACRKTESLMESDNELRIAANDVSDQLKASG